MGWKLWTAWSTLVIIAVGAASTGLVIYSFQQISDSGGDKANRETICDALNQNDGRPLKLGNDGFTVTCIWKKSNSAIRIGTQMLGMIAALLGVWGIVGGQPRVSFWYLGLSVIVTVMSFVSMCFDADAIRKARTLCSDLNGLCKSSTDPFIFTTLYSAALFLAWGFSTYSAYQSYRSRKDHASSRLRETSSDAVAAVQRAAPPPPPPAQGGAAANPFSI
jgi:hypothetical protein